ncbi:MAG TPA: hypothetical protein VMQ86_14010 [Bryobacteraceae bacterium]|nr:hypothetical protein [Bryobacteraceae bacterium]
MYRVKERVSHAGLYRCTTCGVTIQVNAGEALPVCPSQCADAIWTFFNEWNAPTGEIRETAEAFPALDLSGDPRQIPVGSRLTEIHLGPERLASFHFDGQVYFGSSDELFHKTRVIP